MPVVSDKPYVPVTPYHGTIWPRVLNRLLIPRLLRKTYGIRKISVVHAEKLRASLNARHGILVTPNHSRDEDPFVLSALAREAGHPFFVVASAHLFMESPSRSFLLRRAGAFSIYREGMDKQAVQTSIEILESAERPLVIFPEGHISRTNGRLTPMLEGTALIARQAAKKRAKEEPAKQVVVHPVAIRYSFPFDVAAAAAKTLDQIETRLTWKPDRSVAVHERVRKVGAALLSLKELEHLGHVQAGDIPTRIAALIDALLAPLEDEYCNANHAGHPVARVKRLRSTLLPDMIKGDLTEAEKGRRWRLLDTAELAQQLYHYPPDYLPADAPAGRLLETIERLEEDLTGKVSLHGPVEATVTVCDAVPVPAGREARGEADPLMAGIEASLRQALGIAS